MKTYRTNRTVQITGGQVELSEDQARRRVGVLRKTEKEGVYEIMRSTQFKAGEVFGFDGDVPKTSSDDMEEVGRKGKPAESTDAPAASYHTHSKAKK